MKKYRIGFTDGHRIEQVIDVFSMDKVRAQKQIEENFKGCFNIRFLSESPVTEVELNEINDTGSTRPKQDAGISIVEAMSNLMEFAPNIYGVCPECGRSLVFEGWKCFVCGFDTHDMTGDQKLRALNGWSRFTERLKAFSDSKPDSK